MAQTQSSVAKMKEQSTNRATEKRGEQGKTTIADLVVAKIAGIAAREIEGVHELVTQGVGRAIAGLTQRVIGSDTRGKGIEVEIGEREAAIDLRMIAQYGFNIPEVTEAVRTNIIERIKEMTGLIVREVNIDVMDLYFPEDEPSESERRLE